MSEVIYTESCCAGSLCTALNLGDSSSSSLSVGVCRIKSNNQTKYVELPVEDSRTGVQFPPPPPIEHPKPSKEMQKSPQQRAFCFVLCLFPSTPMY